MSGHVVIAVDGPAASGKGTLARRLAAELGYAYLDTGLLYRVVGLILIRQGLDPADENAAAEAAIVFDAATADFNDPALRDEETSKAAGIVAAFPAVRAALVDVQRRFAANPPGGAEGGAQGGARGGARGAVLDGRDIGTVICPDADYKFFIEADIEERARRRVKELRDRGDTVTLARVLQEMKERDERDRTRAVAPLAPAADASVVNTTNLNADAAFALAMSLIR
jgi:cytidylate kinase